MTQRLYPLAISQDGSVVLDPMGGVGTIAIEVETSKEVMVVRLRLLLHISYI